MAAPSKKFFAQTATVVEDVEAKFAREAVVDYKEFFCPEDPLQSFSWNLEFRSSESKGEIRVNFFPLGQDIKLSTEIIVVYDDKNKRVGETAWSGVHYVEKDTISEWDVSLDPMPRFEKNCRWRILYFLEYTNEPMSSIPSATSRSTFHEGFSRLFDDGRHADFSFIVEGEKIMAHKAVLVARCSYFERLFESGMKESSSYEIEIKDVALPVFQELLRYLYSDELPNYSPRTMDILVAADKYGIEALKENSESNLCCNIDSENVIDALILTELVNCPKVEATAATYFKRNVKVLKNSSDWKKLESHPRLMLKLLSSF